MKTSKVKVTSKGGRVIYLDVDYLDEGSFSNDLSQTLRDKGYKWEDYKWTFA